MNPEGKTEEQLATELEAMYKLVAESEKSVTEVNEGGATIPPDIHESPVQAGDSEKSLAEVDEGGATISPGIHESPLEAGEYEKSLSEVKEGDATIPPGIHENPLQAAESEKSLAEVNEGDATIPPVIHESPVQEGEAQKGQERVSDYIPLPPVQPVSRSIKQRSVLNAAIIVFVCLCVMLYAVFFWPTLYEVATIKAGNNSYPVRINRITGNVIYFDGEQWRETPIPAPAPQVSQVLPPSPEIPVKPSEGAEYLKGTLSQEKGGVQTPQKSGDQAGSAGLPSADLKANLKEKESPDAVRISAKEKPFAIQVKAFNNWAEAQTALAAIKKTGVDAHYMTVPLGDRGTWYRILIGRFKSPVEAMQFMKKNRMKDFYEGCFIQKYS